MGELVRVRVLVPLSHSDVLRRAFGQDGQKRLADDVQSRVESLGFYGTKLVTQDPTDNRLFSVLTYPKGGQRGSSDGILQLVDVTPVEEPPRAPRSLVGVQLNKSSLEVGAWDSGLTSDEVWAIQTALRSESDPRHLTGFASTLEPSFPVAASLLRVRSAALEPGSEPAPVTAASPNLGAIDQKKAAVDAFAAQRNIPSDLMREEVQKAVCALVQNIDLKPETMRGTPPEIAALAGLLVKDVLTRRSGPTGGRDTLRIADVTALRRAFPPTGREGYISPSALQLALAANKPKMSGVGRAPQTFSLFDELERGDVPPHEQVQLLKARASMNRALRALERGRWVEWYRRSLG